MKNILLALLFGSISTCLAQQSYTLRGKVESEIQPKKIYMQYVSGGSTRIDSALVKDKSFVFRGRINEPVAARLYFDYTQKGISDPDNKKDFKVIYLEPTNIELTVVDSLKKAKVFGSKVNDDFKTYLSLSDSLNDIVMSLRKAAAKDPSIRTNFRSQMKVLEERNREAFKKYVNDYPTSFFSLNALNYLINNNVNSIEVDSLFNRLSADLQGSSSGLQMKRTLHFLKITEIGKPVLDFVQNDVNNIPVSTANYRGQYLLIDFWASWCAPCRGENPYLVRAYQQYKENGFEILGVSLDDSNKRDAWIKAIEDDELAWAQVSDLKGWKNEAAVLYGIQSIPSNFLIDPSGVIIARNLRGVELETILKNIFSKQTD